MQYSILTDLENTARRFPEKTAVIEDTHSVCWGEFASAAKRVGTALARENVAGKPVATYMEKSIEALNVFFGAVYAGACYSYLNPELPNARLNSIQSVLNAAIIVTTDSWLEITKQTFPDAKVVSVSALLASEIDEELLSSVRARAIDTDPLYINFTSGSTGTPKGIAVGHRSVIDFIDCFTELFSITEKDVIANQAPLDFDVSVKDIYSAIKTGASLVLIPRWMFVSPTTLIDFLCETKVTTLTWAVSALCLITTFHGLDYKTPETIEKVLFSGEVMPMKHLKNWMEHLPNATFVNLYGPTEITCNCTYHVLSRERSYSGGLPIGKPFPNERVFLLDSENREITAPDVPGEICVAGSALALGYYRNPEQNQAHFVQNPLNDRYPETIYRTGDLGKYAESGELFFCGRKDFQIKHMGHRIELEEVERAMAAIDGVERCCCTFDEKKSRLRGYYVGSIDKKALHEEMTKSLPIYMVPGTLRQIDEMPLTKNGKIDRRLLDETYGGRRG